MPTVHGKVDGLRRADVRTIERLSRRRMGEGEILSAAMARAMAQVSAAVRRRVGVLVDRRGRVTHVAVGDAHRIWLPDFGRMRAGVGRLRGLRWLVTHLTGEPLSRDDLLDLVRLRLDLVASISVDEAGLPTSLHLGHLVPGAAADAPYEVLGPLSPHDPGVHFAEFIAELERALASAAPRVAPQKIDGRDATRAVLAWVDVPGAPPAEAGLAELRELARTAGLHVVDEHVQRRRQIDPRFVLGSGRLSELVLRALQLEAEVIVFGRDLSPAQTRGLAAATELKVIDRTQLILDIFAQHAHTRDGKLQVELAQLRYRLPRLAGKGTALSRLAGGIGGRGPGETKLEIDRRRTKDRIRLLEKRIDKLSKQRAVRRSKRTRGHVPIVGIVGYTNAGKSTLLNALTGSEVLVEDKLFATLDPTSRRLRFPEEREIVLIDTVGFIRELPPDLVISFRATLEEIRTATLLLHVVDLSDPQLEAHIASVEDTLRELDLGRISRLLVLNKADQAHDETLRRYLEDREGAVAVSAIERESLGVLVGRLGRALFEGATVRTSASA